VPKLSCIKDVHFPIYQYPQTPHFHISHINQSSRKTVTLKMLTTQALSKLLLLLAAVCVPGASALPTTVEATVQVSALKGRSVDLGPCQNYQPMVSRSPFFPMSLIRRAERVEFSPSASSSSTTTPPLWARSAGDMLTRVS
jgi:hypothetical protein